MDKRGLIDKNTEQQGRISSDQGIKMVKNKDRLIKGAYAIKTGKKTECEIATKIVIHLTIILLMLKCIHPTLVGPAPIQPNQVQDTKT